MKVCFRLTLFICLLLPLLSAAEQVVWVQNSCCAGSPFTLKIPIKPAGVSGAYRWYRNDTLIVGSEVGTTAGTTAVTLAISDPLTRGDSVRLYFKYRLDDDYPNVWTKSPTYMVSFPVILPTASEITGDTTVCAGSTSTYSVNGELGVTYHWELPDGWTQTAGGTTHSITVRAGADGGTVRVTPSNGCGVGAPHTLTVSVNEASTLTRLSGDTAQVICQGSAIENIFYTRGGSATGSDIIGLPAGVSYIDDNGSIMLSGTPTEYGTFTYTIATSGHTDPCMAATATGTITVRQASTLTRLGGEASQAICQGTALDSIFYTRGGSATGMNIVWQPSAPAGIGYAAVGTTRTIGGTATGYGTAIYTITTTGHTAPCAAATATGTVTVNQTSTLVRNGSGGAASQTVCQGTVITSIAYTPGGSATSTSIEWQPNAPAGISYDPATRTISGTPTDTGAFTYTITTHGHTPPCTAAVVTGTLTVRHASRLTRDVSSGAALQTVCQHNPIDSIIYIRSGSATNTSISWTPSTPAGISYDPATGTLSGTPTGSGIFTYTITTTGHTSPCGAAMQGGTITVHPASTLTLVSAGSTVHQEVCPNTGIADVEYTLGGSASSASIVWSGGSAPVSLSSGVSGSTASISGILRSWGVFSYTITTSGHTAPCVAVTATGEIVSAIVDNGGHVSLTSCTNGITYAGKISYESHPDCNSPGLTYGGKISLAAAP